jgi:multiple RNA-binding domain-containing protein 1
LKLKEFLEVMQPPSKAKKWGEVDESAMEPPTKVQAMELPEAESDEEYEKVPKKTRQKSPPKVAPVEIPIPSVPETTVDETPAVAETPVPAEATDDDWLRSRTNRLLDLMDPEDIATTQRTSATVEDTTEDVVGEPPAAEDEVMEDAQEDEEKPDPVLEAIRSNGRLFVRNLPYTATEDDLREHFAPYGSLEEVCILISSFAPSFMMNIQIGTTYA